MDANRLDTIARLFAGRRLSRRAAVRQGGAGLAAGAFAAAGLGGRGGAAQAVDPAASPAAADGLIGQYAIIRVRKLKADQSIELVMATVAEEFAPMVASIPGFISYVGSANPETRDTFYVGVFADKAGADESTRRATEWLTTNAYDQWFEGDPAAAVAAEGAIAFAAAADQPPA